MSYGIATSSQTLSHRHFLYSLDECDVCRSRFRGSTIINIASHKDMQIILPGAIRKYLRTNECKVYHTLYKPSSLLELEQQT